MCGRFYLDKNKANIAGHFAIEEFIESKNNYNITPSQKCSIIRLDDYNKELAKLNWGLVPSWTKSDVKIKPINAKAETIREKPYFRSAYKKQRCIIPASGFYEWKGRHGQVVLPSYLIRLHVPNDQCDVPCPWYIDKDVNNSDRILFGDVSSRASGNDVA